MHILHPTGKYRHPTHDRVDVGKGIAHSQPQMALVGHLLPHEVLTGSGECFDLHIIPPSGPCNSGERSGLSLVGEGRRQESASD